MQFVAAPQRDESVAHAVQPGARHVPGVRGKDCGRALRGVPAGPGFATVDMPCYNVLIPVSPARGQLLLQSVRCTKAYRAPLLARDRTLVL